MRIGGIGSYHDNHSHRVTECMHASVAAKEKTGGAKASSAANMEAQPKQITNLQQEGQFSLSAWLDKSWGKAKKIFGRIWGSSDENGMGKMGIESMEAGLPGHGNAGEFAGGANVEVSGQSHANREDTAFLEPHEVAAMSAAVTQPQALQNNSYFAAIEDTGRQQETLWQKVKVKFKDVAGQLMGQLPGRFAGFFAGNSFQAGQEQSKEDLRRNGKYREGKMELEGMDMEDSHLMDSYDRTGNYSKLAGGVQSNISVRK